MAIIPSSLPKDAVWLVTGTSSGIGLAFIDSILTNPNYRVVALTRNPASVSLPKTSNHTNTLVLAVDLASETSVAKAFETTISRFGRIDVVVNNAGYAVLGEFESIGIQEAREQFDINYWGSVFVTRHAVRVMREINPQRGSIGGVIAQITSAGGFVSTPGLTIYQSTKWALEALSEGLSKELDPAWEIRIVAFEPGSVNTEWSGGNMRHAVQHAAYVGKGLGAETLRNHKTTWGASPKTVSDFMVKIVVNEDGKWDGPFLRLPIGADAYAVIKNDVEDIAASLEKWKQESESTSSSEVMEGLRKMGLLSY